MSLQVWLPLNGNLKNYGVGDLTAASVQSGVVIDDNGKIGKCYTNSGSNTYVSTPIVFNSNQFSLCAWVKVNSRRNNWCRALGLAGSGTYIGLGCEHANSSSYGFHFYKTIDETNTNIFDTYPLHSQNGTWVHYAMCYDGVKYYIYQNGTLIQSGNTNKTNIPVNMTSLSLFGGVNGTYSNCSLNDVRLYDECISPKIVKEISKGLVCHYKLSGVGNTNLLIGNYSNYKTSTTNNSSGNLTLDTNLMPYSSMVGKTFTFSFDYSCEGARANSGSGMDNRYGLHLSLNITPNGGTATQHYPCANYLYMSGTGRAIQSFSVPSNCTVNNFAVSIQPTTKPSSDNNATWYIKNVKLEEGTKATTWCPNPSDTLYSTLGYNDGIEYDCSGNRHNGTKVGDIAWSGDSARYSGSYMLTTNSSYISTTLNTSGYANSYTFSYWAKISDMNMKMAFGFGDGNRLNLFPMNSKFCWNTGDSANNPFQNSGTDVTFTSYNGEWHHYTITGNGTTTTLYIDGEKKGTAKAYRSITGTKLFLSGWDTGTSYKWTGGNISDFRLYSTCFSESDVKSLYNVSASIDKTGVLSAYEFIEEG